MRKAPIGLCSPRTMRRKRSSGAEMTQSAAPSPSLTATCAVVDGDTPAAGVADVEAIGGGQAAGALGAALGAGGQVLEELAGCLWHQIGRRGRSRAPWCVAYAAPGAGA